MNSFISEENPCYEKVSITDRHVSTALAFEEFTKKDETTTEWDECLDYLEKGNSRMKEGLGLLYIILVPIYYAVILILVNALRRDLKNGQMNGIS